VGLRADLDSEATGISGLKWGGGMADRGDLVVAHLSLDPTEEDGFLKTNKIRSTTSFGGEVKPSVPCRKILRHVKNPYEYEKRYFVEKIQQTFLAKFLLFLY
jgi:hypothetical protein